MRIFSLPFACGLAVVVAALFSPTFGPQRFSGVALAESSDEKDAFEAAKELGTVAAWNAFLANYQTGFHADLARAYLKKLNAEPQQAAQPSRFDDFPVVAGSWGGIVRNGPGEDHRKIDSLDEGDEVTLVARTDVIKDGYPWFKISYGDDQSGYQWGGILCAVGTERPDVFKTCPEKKGKSAKSEESDEREERTERKRGCSHGRVLVDGKCLKERAAVELLRAGVPAAGGKMRAWLQGAERQRAADARAEEGGEQGLPARTGVERAGGLPRGRLTTLPLPAGGERVGVRGSR